MMNLLKSLIDEEEKGGENGVKTLSVKLLVSVMNRFSLDEETATQLISQALKDQEVISFITDKIGQEKIASSPSLESFKQEKQRREWYSEYKKLEERTRWAMKVSIPEVLIDEDLKRRFSVIECKRIALKRVADHFGVRCTRCNGTGVYVQSTIDDKRCWKCFGYKKFVDYDDLKIRKSIERAVEKDNPFQPLSVGEKE
ncbi:hypothetical protein [Salirhabdus euzebyi]|uniref:hypothetical protein n=1 Tax=Salirhabdus euzebyi TaxID=394506 RepID=UPI001C2CF46F|nr:hypothetical protein [Salirhabdus euzebyi]